MSAPAAPVWDLAVVGAGPAGSAAALAALHDDPSARVLLLDRADFPRDKVCGDGVAPHVLDLLADIGVRGLLDHRRPVGELVLRHGSASVRRTMARPAYVVPRHEFDQLLVAAALAAGAVWRRHRVRRVRHHGRVVVLDEQITARHVVAADGAGSPLRRSLGLPVGRQAFAIRGYAPVSSGRAAVQEITFGPGLQPSYAWSFDRGDGWANVGYGELLHPRRPTPTRSGLVAQVERLLPDSTAGATAWRAHHLPLSGWRWRQPDGRMLLAGDAAQLVNPLTGEGIYYAVATGIGAARAAAAATRSGRDAGAVHRTTVRAAWSRHLRHTAALARGARVGAAVDAGIAAATDDQRVFDDLVEIGLAAGRVRVRTAAAVVAAGWRPQRDRRSRSSS